MASTSDLAPNRKPAAARAASADSKVREVELEAQISQLQDDLKGIAATLAKLTNDKVTEVTEVAKSEARHLKRQGQHVVEDVQEQAGEIEQQLKDTIREKPLTSVATAAGIGFLLALITR